MNPLIIGFLLCWPVAADIVELKTGERIEGSFREIVQDRATVELMDQILTIPVEQIRSIQFGKLAAKPESSASLRQVVDSLIDVRKASEAGDLSAFGDALFRLHKRLDTKPEPPVKLAAAYYDLAYLLWSPQMAASARVVAWPYNGKDKQYLQAAQMILDNSELCQCPAIARIAEQTKADSEKSWRYGSDPLELRVRSLKPEMLFPCASAKIEEAEKLLEGK